jgi:hypothetical protein
MARVYADLLECHAAVVVPFSCIRFPLSLKVLPFSPLTFYERHDLPHPVLLNRGSHTHRGCADRGIGCIDSRPEWVSRILTCTLTAQLSPLYRSGQHFLQRLGAEQRSEELMWWLSRRIECLADHVRHLRFRQIGVDASHTARIKSSQMHCICTVPESELMHEP